MERSRSIVVSTLLPWMIGMNVENPRAVLHLVKVLATLVNPGLRSFGQQGCEAARGLQRDNCVSLRYSCFGSAGVS